MILWCNWAAKDKKEDTIFSYTVSYCKALQAECYGLCTELGLTHPVSHDLGEGHGYRQKFLQIGCQVITT